MHFECLEFRYLLALYGPDVSLADGGVADVLGDIVLDVLPDGRILAVGYQQLPRFDDDLPAYQSTATRLNADGTIDTTFADDGVIEFGESGNWVSAIRSGSRFYVTRTFSDQEIEPSLSLRGYSLAFAAGEALFQGVSCSKRKERERLGAELPLRRQPQRNESHRGEHHWDREEGL